MKKFQINLRTAQLVMVGFSLSVAVLLASNSFAFDDVKNTSQAENHANGDHAKSKSGTLEQRL